MTELVAAIGAAAESLAPNALERMASSLESGGGRSALLGAVPTGGYRAAAERIARAWDAEPGVPPIAVSLALRSARERVVAARRQRVSLVWTGPDTPVITTRRTDQALLQLVNASSQRLVVVSFAVYRATAVAQALGAASDRGVRVELVLEPDQANALGRHVMAQAAVYVWPEELRPRNETGGRGVVHAKCAVADGKALLVSSANLTESALTLNMELGLLVEGGEVPRRVQEHLDALVAGGQLQLYSAAHSSESTSS
jgi:phosphatidylserine/phosphatidylglycerophosphate/cardiolipin synthase-like enzyme